MATKKQKREAAEAKRAKFEEKLRADGLRAQKADQEARVRREAETRAKVRKFEIDLQLKALQKKYPQLTTAEVVEAKTVRDFHEALAVGGFFFDEHPVSNLEDELCQQDEQLIEEDIIEQSEPNFEGMTG